MTDLVLWEHPYTIRVRLPASRPCNAEGCDLPAKGQMLWIEQKAEMLWVDEICGHHLFTLRNRVKQNGGGALFYPLDYRIPVELIATKIREYKMAQMVQQQQVFRPMFMQTGTGTNFFPGTHTFNIRFG